MAEAMPETGNHQAGDNQARDSQVGGNQARNNQALDNQERLDRMRRAMAENRLDALVVRLPENVLLLSGFWPMIGATVLVFPLEGSPVCIVPGCYEQEASRSLWESRAAYYKYGVLGAPDPKTAIRQSLQGVHGSEQWRRIGYEGSFEVAAPSWNSAESLVSAAPTLEMLKGVFGRGQLIDTTGLLESERRRKTAYECAKLRLASEISVFGMEAFEAAAETGASGVELVALVEREIMVRGTGYGGVSRVRAFAQVAVGNEESAVGYRPNEVSTARRLASGDVALLELGVVADGYWADRTRLRVAGQPTDEQAKIFEIVLGAQEAAIATIRAGVSGDEVDQAARSVIREAGYGESFPHITGHGLGFRYHESSPILAPKSFEVLEEGMLTSVEPGIYLQRAGGFRIEDDVLVKESGAEVLGKFRKAIQ